MLKIKRKYKQLLDELFRLEKFYNNAYNDILLDKSKHTPEFEKYLEGQANVYYEVLDDLFRILLRYGK